jgi:spermidine synthase
MDLKSLPDMDNIKRTALLFAVIVIEGYVVLATELLAIREVVPYAGSGTDTVSIIIAAVLMPLAFGYYNGGQFKPYIDTHGRYVGIRRKLIFNIMTSMMILAMGLSYVGINIFFTTLIASGLNHRLLMCAAYCAIFLVTPIYLLGQTIPLISNYFGKEKLSRITGRILFLSTMGSFMGATFSTLVLMSTVGVHNTVSLNLVLLAILVILLSKNKLSESVLYAFGIAIVTIMINSGTVIGAFDIVENNQYNTVMIRKDSNGGRHLLLNDMGSSMYNPETGQKHFYIEFLEQKLIEPVRATGKPKEFLIIGAGAFTFGLEDTVNHYEYVDIDSSLQKIAEEHVIMQKLGENKKFTPMEARAFLRGTKKKYDVIVLDAYLGDVTIPEHLVTQDFYRQVKDHLTDQGIVAMNVIVSPSFSTPFSRHLDNTIRSVFPYVSRHVIFEDYGLWSSDPDQKANVIYLYRRQPDENDKEIYTDNLNRIFYDKPQKK